jgi:mannose-1-phosphate guanylyltransferase
MGGVEPSSATDDYGWIVPCPQNGTPRLRPVMAFHEKPDRLVASALYSVGAVWSTMVTVARARTLFGVYREQVPALAGVFVRALRMPRADRPAWLATAYESLAPVDFSRDLMATTMGLTAYVWPRSMGWSDLGTPSRLSRWLDPRGAAATSRHPSAGGAVRAPASSADSREHPATC